MTISIFYTDLRRMPSRLESHVVEWRDNLTAFDVVEQALGLALAQNIEQDLLVGSKEIMVCWWNKETDDHSEIGGVGTHGWTIPDYVVLTVSYENGATTQNQIDDAIRWTLEQEL